MVVVLAETHAIHKMPRCEVNLRLFSSLLNVLLAYQPSSHLKVV